jgi:heparin/heparan-sulfate lyase
MNASMQWLGACAAVALLIPPSAAKDMVLEAEAARLAPDRVEVVAHESLGGGRGVALRAGVAEAPNPGRGAADVTFTARIPATGRYVLLTYTTVDEAAAARMRAARSKHDSIHAALRIGDRPPVRRVVYLPWEDEPVCRERAGIFDLEAGDREIAFWLPAGVRLDRILLSPYKPPAIPPEAAAYQPPILPPPTHPRLWVDAASLARIRANLDHPENKPHWDRVRAAAAKPFAFKPPAEGEIAYNTPLEQAALAKAFCRLAAGDDKAGREAADLMLAYLPRVEFGNLLDITREVGAAIYAAACVYDWCHDLLTPDERATLRRHMIRLAESMECGWPPFRQSIVNGHGNEAQINRDLLAMSIAVHDDDPDPYRYCAWHVLEQLVPLRRFEYQSPRHNQGINYGAYRFAWEMHAAWLMRRMCGREVFDPNIKGVPNYWIHMRLPDGELLRDGDGVPSRRPWRHPDTFLLAGAYSGDPRVKGEWVRQGGLRDSNPLLVLLLNDPVVAAVTNLDVLPHTFDFGSVLGGMVARTGWTMGTNSPEVVAEIRGGGHHFGNHQHADAGSFQIYYRGLQAARLAQYKFYGTPYDMNFGKRSIAQNMVLVVDPAERFLRTKTNDGGSRFLQSYPRTPRQAVEDPLFDYGRVVACSHGPSSTAPAFSYFSADLRAAYSDKMAGYVRQFCVLNLGRPGNPAVIIVRDDVESAKPEFRKFWQVNTLRPPQTTPSGVRLWNVEGGVTGRLDVAVLEPAADARTVEILDGEAAYSVFGMPFTPPAPDAPEAHGTRVMVSPRTARSRDRFLVVMQPCDDDPLQIVHENGDGVVSLRLADRIAALAAGRDLVASPFEITVPADGTTYRVLCAGLKAGKWKATSPGQPDRVFAVAPGKHTLFLESAGARLRIAPAESP